MVAAPSGAGKTSLCKSLLRRLDEEDSGSLTWSCSYTTRKPRAGEVDGRDYFFVDDDTFDGMVAREEFAEWANVHGRRYGTGRKYLEEAAASGTDLLVEIDIQGARQLREKQGRGIFVFILPPSWRALEERLSGRGTEEADEVSRRLLTARAEVLEWNWFDYIIVNEDFGRAVDDLRSVIVAARLRREVVRARVEDILAGLKMEE